jgi:hypothetical protein
MRRKFVAIIAMLAAVAAGEMLTWQHVARQRLIAHAPQMVHIALLLDETTLPGNVDLVLAEPLSHFAKAPAPFATEFRPARVSLMTERDARASGRLTESACAQCFVIRYRELVNNALFAKTWIHVWSGDQGGAAYFEYFLNVFGWWVHVNTQLVGMS